MAFRKIKNQIVFEKVIGVQSPFPYLNVYNFHTTGCHGNGVKKLLVILILVKKVPIIMGRKCIKEVRGDKRVS